MRSPSYEELVKAFPVILVSSRFTETYPGDLIFIFKDYTKRVGFLIQGFGPRFGYDELESCQFEYDEPWFLSNDLLELTKRMWYNIRWFPSKEYALNWITTNQDNWYRFDTTIMDYLKESFK